MRELTSAFFERERLPVIRGACRGGAASEPGGCLVGRYHFALIAYLIRRPIVQSFMGNAEICAAE